MLFAANFPGMGLIPLIQMAFAVGVLLGVFFVARWIARRIRPSSIQPRDQFLHGAVTLALMAVVLIPMIREFAPISEKTASQRIRKGMTLEEIESRFGRPHNSSQSRDGSATWCYKTAWFGDSYLCIQFNPDGLVENEWVD
jgi:hypothetical protein